MIAAKLMAKAIPPTPLREWARAAAIEAAALMVRGRAAEILAALALMMLISATCSKGCSAAKHASSRVQAHGAGSAASLRHHPRRHAAGPISSTLADGKAINLKLPAGVDDGTIMRLKDKGQLGIGGYGDGIVMVEVGSHPFFRREGDNIRMDLPITLDEAVRGAKVKCPTVDGAVMLTIKPGTNGGTVLRLAGKGWTKKNGKVVDGKPERGDQLVTLEIQLPEDLAALEQRLEGWVDTARPREKFGL